MFRVGCSAALQMPLIFGGLLASTGTSPAQSYDMFKVEVFAEGHWQQAQKKSTAEFLVWYGPGWPQHVPVRITWLSKHPDTQYHCSMLTELALSTMVLKRNGQVQQVQIKEGPPGRFITEISNVPRYPPSNLRVDCNVEDGPAFAPGAEPYQDSSGYGEGSISMHPQDPLGDWNPGISSSSPIEILMPAELALIQRNEALWVKVKITAFGQFLQQHLSEGASMTVEVERAVDVQTGWVGDINVGNKPYITKWQPVKAFSVPLEFSTSPFGIENCDQYQSHFLCTPQVPGYLTAERLRAPSAHQTGYYRVRVVIPEFDESAWRMFRVPGIIQDVAKASLAFPSKAELTCQIAAYDGKWGTRKVPDGAKISVKGDSEGIQFYVKNEDLAEAKDFTIKRTLTKKSDRVRVGDQRRMKVKTETLTLKGKMSASSTDATFTDQVQLAVGEAAVVRGWMEVDSGNVVDETNETNNSCSYEITIHRVE